MLDFAQYRLLVIAQMAATLEAGDRAARGAVPHGDPRTDGPFAYVHRAVELYEAATKAEERLGPLTSPGKIV